MKKTGMLILHMLYWGLFLLLLLALYFFAVFVPSHTGLGMLKIAGIFPWLKLMTGFAIIPGLLSFYVFYSYLFSKYLGRQQFLAFALSGLLAAMGSVLAGAAAGSYLFGHLFLFGDGYHSALFILVLMTLLALINGAVGAVVKGFLTWFNEIRLKEELHRKNYEMELALVKAQIDPHFLFNTLNNIDILIAKDAATASAYLHKLSGIMRFMLYETKGERISLEKDVNYLKQYIELQQLRTSNPDYVRLLVPGDLSGTEIAPMLFLPFIENAFKHTEGQKATATIRIELRHEKDKLSFLCENSRIKEPTQPDDGGLGNHLIRRRLELVYPGKHQLTVDQGRDHYRVKLDLWK
jgi:two-component system, LytTR family, sensor kinase